MMTINNTNGEFQFNKWIFSPTIKFSDIKANFSAKEFELWTSNDQWISYRLNISEEYIFVIMFFEESIRYIEVYPKKTNETSGVSVLQRTLQNLGGENSYPWGKVELNIDRKAGYESVVISYH